ncbi:hypothetical protein FQR65_LT02434 [Abscondita terminalis]|nr:hypothetical protein FQR65_LT02434 [Abscondita terminalis]
MPNFKSTGELLSQLRQIMMECKYYPQPLSAYIVPSADAHNSEYPAENDKRRAFISGFTGSAGTAIITPQHACMWTDGRYFLQASQEMDSNWTLMKEGVPTTPSQELWLIKNLPPSSFVGADPNVMSHKTWTSLQEQLEVFGHKLSAVETNLIDLIWADRPAAVSNPIAPLELKFSGKPIKDKLADVRLQMKEKSTTIMVLTALDEIAWFLNLRGSDVEFNPVFFAFVILVPDCVILLIDSGKITPEVKEHLKNEIGDVKVQIESYSKVKDILKQSINNYKDGFVWLSGDANYAITSVVPSCRLKTEITPSALMKAVKNKVEVQGMRNAHIKDAAALCCYFSWLEEAIKTETVTEISGAKKLEYFRSLQADHVGPSFETISSVGPHGSIIHYRPETSTDVPITADVLYLCDSGAQFKDGTTDVTRTFHFGTPTDHEKECYTRVLRGQLRMGRAIFPTKIKGNCLDSFARQYLWDVGLDYGHGTSHGIGCYLNVHEGPMGVSWKNFPDDPGFEEGMFISNEPGYYEDGKFGIRIEDIVHVIAADTPHNFNNRGFLTFETVTLVPKQTKLIQKDMLSKMEIDQLNAYHQKCRDVIGPLLEKQGFVDAKKWLWKETEPI